MSVGSDRLGPRQSDVSDLPLLYGVSHRADRFLDGGIGVGAMLVIEVYVLQSQAVEAGINGFLNVGGISFWSLPVCGSELGCNNGLIAPAFKGNVTNFIRKDIYVCGISFVSSLTELLVYHK